MSEQLAVRGLSQAAALFGGIVVLGGGPATASAEAASPFENGPGNIAGLASVPKAITSDQASDAAYMNGLDCSGGIIHAKNGRDIGAVTAEHCGLTEESNERILGSNGKTYIVQPNLVKAQTGPTMDGLKTAVAIHRYIVPKNGNNTRDLALGIGKGEKVSEVLASYRRSALRESKLRKLKIGDKVTMIGWPSYAPGNTTGIDRREELNMTVRALGQTTTTLGKKLNVVWTEGPPNKDGAICSFRSSGSEGRVKIGRKEWSIGILSVFNDLSGSTPGYPGADIISTPPPKLNGSNTSGVCGFSYRVSSPENGTGLVLNAVRSFDKIPGYVTPEEAKATARAQFKDPTYPKTILNGVINLPIEAGGGGKNNSTPYGIWVSNPVLFHDVKNETTIVGWADPQDPDHLKFAYFKDKNFWLAAYPHSSTDPVKLEQSTGPYEYTGDPSGQTSGNFVAPDRGPIGKQSPDQPDFADGTSTVRVKKGGDLTVQPNKK